MFEFFLSFLGFSVFCWSVSGSVVRLLLGWCVSVYISPALRFFGGDVNLSFTDKDFNQYNIETDFSILNRITHLSHNSQSD